MKENDKKDRILIVEVNVIWCKMRIPVLVWIFQGIPECIGITALIMSLDAKPFNLRIIGGIGIVQALVAYILRAIPLTPGVHVFLLPISMALLAAKVGRVRLDKALIYAVIVSVIIAIWEILFHLTLDLTGIINLPFKNHNSFLRIILGMPQVVLLFVISIIVNKTKFKDDILTKKLFVLHDK